MTIPAMRTSPKVAAKREATRARLIDAAYAILRDLGHVGLRFSSVSDLAGVSRGGLLHHFATKQHLVAAVFDDIVRKMEAASWERIETARNGCLFEAIVADARARFFNNSYYILLDILVSCPNEQQLETVRNQLRAELSVLALEGWQKRLEAAGLAASESSHAAAYLWNIVRGLAIRNTVQTEPDYCDRIIAYAIKVLRERFPCTSEGANTADAPEAMKGFVLGPNC